MLVSVFKENKTKNFLWVSMMTTNVFMAQQDACISLVHIWHWRIQICTKSRCGYLVAQYSDINKWSFLFCARAPDTQRFLWECWTRFFLTTKNRMSFVRPVYERCWTYVCCIQSVTDVDCLLIRFSYDCLSIDWGRWGH